MCNAAYKENTEPLTLVLVRNHGFRVLVFTTSPKTERRNPQNGESHVKKVTCVTKNINIRGDNIQHTTHLQENDAGGSLGGYG